MASPQQEQLPYMSRWQCVLTMCTFSNMVIFVYALVLSGSRIKPLALVVAGAVLLLFMHFCNEMVFPAATSARRRPPRVRRDRAGSIRAGLVTGAVFALILAWEAVVGNNIFSDKSSAVYDMFWHGRQKISVSSSDWAFSGTTFASLYGGLGWALTREDGAAGSFRKTEDSVFIATLGLFGLMSIFLAYLPIFHFLVNPTRVNILLWTAINVFVLFILESPWRRRPPPSRTLGRLLSLSASSRGRDDGEADPATPSPSSGNPHASTFDAPAMVL